MSGALERVEAALQQARSERSKGGAWRCPVPCHGKGRGDRNPSLAVNDKDGRVLLHCRAQCTLDEVLDAIGLGREDLREDGAEPKRWRMANGRAARDDTRPAPRPWTFPEADVSQVHLYAEGLEVVRFSAEARTKGRPKVMPRHRVDGRWMCGLGPWKSRSLPLYREAEAIAELQQGGMVYVTEGEGDADAVVDAGGVACSNIGGAGKFRKHHAETLAAALRDGEPSARIVIVRDMDKPGAEHAADVRDKLLSARAPAADVSIVQPAAGKDAADHLGAGLCLEDLREGALHSEEASDQEEADPFEDATDDGNARRFLRLHGADVLYLPESCRWLVWDGRRFRRDSAEATSARKLAKEAALSLYTEAAAGEDDAARDALLKRATRARSAAAVRSTLFMAAPDVAIEPNALDADPVLLNVRNGTLNLDTRELRPHSRENRITRLAPVLFDPDAQCPRWCRFLEEVQPEREKREFLQRLVGTGFYGRAEDVPMTAHVGGGANGKSSFVETVRGVLGPDYSAELASHALTARRAAGDEIERLLVPIVGARLVTALELGDGQRLHEQAVKRLVSGEPVRVRFLYGESFEVVPVGTLMLTSNHTLMVSGDDDGIWRRVRQVPWTVQIPEDERDPKLREWLLRNEAPGILNWALAGYAKWRMSGLAEPPDVREATALQRADQDSLGAFLEEACTRGGWAWIPNERLRPAYEAWCRRNGVEPLGPTALGTRLQRRGFVREKVGGRRGWRGLDLRVDEDRGEK